MRAACATLKRAEQASAGLAMSAATRMEADLLWSFIAALDDDATSALAHAEMASGSPDPATNYVARVLSRSALWLKGDLRGFAAHQAETSPTTKGRRVQVAKFAQRSMEAATEFQQLRLPMAERMARRVIEQADRLAGCEDTTLLPELVLAQLDYEKGNLAEADSAVRAVLPRVRVAGIAELAVRAYTTLASCAIQQGRNEFATLVLREGQMLGEERGWRRLIAACLALRISMLVDCGRFVDAQGVADKLTRLYPSVDHSACPRAVTVFIELVRCELAIATGAGADAIPALRAMMAEALARGDMLSGVKLGLRLTAAMATARDDHAARTTLLNLIAVGCEVGLFQTFVEAGAAVRDVLVAMQGKLGAPHLDDYAEALLDHWQGSVVEARISKGEKRSEGLLTPRERDVLHHMSLGQSNKVIAMHLGIAPETVKSHAKNIFFRLGSSNRTEAVSRAVSLGMV